MPRSKNPRKFAGRPPKDASRLLERVLRENSLDQRTATAKALRALRDDLAADAGGWENVTSRERLLIERCAAQALIIGAIEAHVFNQPSVITADGALLPSLLNGYVTHVQSLSRMLQALGLRPDRAAKLPDLATYLADRAANAQNTAQDAHTAVLNDFPRATAADTPDDADDAETGAEDAEDDA